MLVRRRAVRKRLQLNLLHLSFGILLPRRFVHRIWLHRVPSGLLLPVRLLEGNGLPRGQVRILLWVFVQLKLFQLLFWLYIGCWVCWLLLRRR
jgi:hypothetical protein